MIYIPTHCGACKGITKALGLVYEVYEKEINKEKPKKIYLYKDFIYNKKVLEEFSSLGIEVIYDINKVSYDDIVIISPLGINKDVYDYLNNNNIEYYDTTCSNIKKIQNIVEEKYHNKYELVLLGSNNDPEIKSIASFCNNDLVIIESIDELSKIKFNDKIFVVSSSTFNKDKAKNIVESLKKLHENALIEVSSSYCNELNKIITSSNSIVNNCDLMFVIGNSNSISANELCNSLNKKVTTYKFSDIDSFKDYILKNDINSNINIGITGARSTPLKEIYNSKYLLSFLNFYKDRIKEMENSTNSIKNKLIKIDDNEIVKNAMYDYLDLCNDNDYFIESLISLGEYIKGSSTNNYICAAESYKLARISSEIHKDILNNTRKKNGKETIPRRICHRFLNEIVDTDYQDDVLKLANGSAIFIGNLGLIEANNNLINNYKGNDFFDNLIGYFNYLFSKNSKSSIYNINNSFLNRYNYSKVNEEDILNIYKNEALFTSCGPFNLGVILSNGISNEELDTIFINIGIIKLLNDDYKMINKNKLSLYDYYVLHTSYKNEYLKLINKNNYEEAKKIIEKSGALEYVQDYIIEISLDTLNIIDKLDLNEESKDILKGLVLYLN